MPGGSGLTNNGFLSGVTHRQIRRHLLDKFCRVRITNLHGDSRYGEVPPEGSRNENVFDIRQGVAVSILSKFPAESRPSLTYADVWGAREEKYARFLSQGMVAHEPIEARAPLWLFHPVSEKSTKEYEGWPLLTEWMPLFSNGIETHKDGLTVHFTSGELGKVIERLLTLPIERARAELAVGHDGRDWSLADAIKSVKAMVARGQESSAITYRPFDVRYTMLNTGSGGFIAYPRWDVMSNIVRIEGKISLYTKDLVKQRYR